MKKFEWQKGGEKKTSMQQLETEQTKPKPEI